MTLEARNLTVTLGKTVVVDSVSLKIEPGEVVAVVGANGAGKSSLLKALCGDIQAAHGEVWMNGKPLAHWKPIERARMRGVLPQSSVLSFPFTVLEIALMGRAPHLKGVESPHDYAIANAALEAAEVLHLQERLYPTLSGGERQRVQFARVLAQIWESSDEHPRYLLVDEPTSSLDLAHQHRTLAVARHFADEGTAVLAILHDLNLAAQYADRILVMKAGKSAAEGTPKAVLTPDIIEAAFGIAVMVMTHPTLDCPLVVPIGGDVSLPSLVSSTISRHN